MRARLHGHALYGRCAALALVSTATRVVIVGTVDGVSGVGNRVLQIQFHVLTKLCRERNF